jgi:hypothetical protein
MGMFQMLLVANGQRNLLRVPGGAGLGVGPGVAVGRAVADAVLPAVGVAPDVGALESSTPRFTPSGVTGVCGAAVFAPSDWDAP